MSGMQKRSSRPQPGCIGGMVRFFDMHGSTAGKKLLMDKPHYRGSSLPSGSVHLDMPPEDYDHVSSQIRKNSGRKPMKMLLDHELPKEVECKYTPPNLVARLMGLDTLPKRQIVTFSGRKEDHGGDMIGLAEEALTSLPHEPEVEQYALEFASGTYNQHVINEDGEDKQDVPFVGRENVEGAHILTNEILYSSEESSEGVVEILKSNKDLFLEVLQQPNSLIGRHLHEMATRSPRDTKRITVLKPSKAADHSDLQSKKTEKWVTKPAQVSQANVRNTSNIGGSPRPSNCKADDDLQPTRIVVLKPSLEKANHNGDEYASPSLSPKTPQGQNYFKDSQHDAQQSREIAKEITNIIRESLGSVHMDESFLSVLSSGYNGDESSPYKSENEYADGSDYEAMSPSSQYSWGYINQFASCSSAMSSVPHARESSVSREAKKRLSRRWNAMGLNGNSQEQTHARSRSSNTLGEMLALSEINKSMRSSYNNEKEPMGSNASFKRNWKEDDIAEWSPRNLTRSKSVPLTAVGNYDWVDVGMSHPEVAESPAGKELHKTNSLKQLVASLFFTRNKKSDKENCIEGTIAEGTASREVGLSVTKPNTTRNPLESQDQPSPNSVLEPLFADDDSKSADSSGILNCDNTALKAQISKAKSPMVGKSPPIESIARTLCWNNSYADAASACPFNPSLVCSASDEERDWFILVPALLATVGRSNDVPSDTSMDRWDALQMSLDPLLKHKYADDSNHSMHEAQRRRWRSNRKLIFDSVDEALMDIGLLDLEANMKCGTGRHPRIVLPVLADQVWATMSQWTSDKVKCVSAIDQENINYNIAIDILVRTEVAGKRWLYSGSIKTETVGIGIEQRLLDDLLEETVLLIV